MSRVRARRAGIAPAIVLFVLAPGAASVARAQAQPPGGESGQTNVPGGPGNQASLPGGQLYQKLCSQCHGEKGDGLGISTPRLLPRPRDFTAGKFKVRTTPSGALPTDDDLRAVIKEGMPYTSMPGWSHLADEQIDELVAAVKSFSPDFADAARKPAPIAIPDAPKFTQESAEKGKSVFAENGCAACHGEVGRGDGTSALGLEDDWGNPIRPADLTKRWTFRGGATREDIYRTFTTGMNGTPMPSFAESLSDEQRWQLVDYIAGLGPSDEPAPEPHYAELLQVKWSDEELDLARGRELFEAAPPAYFSVVGQVTEPGRAFHPSANGVTVRAVYNAREIAFLVTWHDMRADQRGENAPDIRVPPEEDEGEAPAAGGAAAPAGEEGDFWGGEAEAAPAAAPSEDGDFWGDEGGAAAAAVPAGEAFSDAVAIQLPVQLPTGIRKPYFLFGDAENPVDVWFVDLARTGAETAARRYLGAGSASLTPVEGEDVVAAASYDKGEWSVILKRGLKSTGGVTFAEAQYVPIAFSLWDGAARERGNKRGLTQWKYLYTMPKSTPSPAWPMLRSALAVLAIEVGLVAWVRRRKKNVQSGEAEAHV